MKKKWIIFETDYTDGDNQEFKKGQIVEVAEDIANALIALKKAKDTANPSDGIVEKAMEGLAKSLEAKLEKTFQGVFDQLNKQFAGIKVPGITAKEEDKLAKMNGFTSDGDFIKAVFNAESGHIDQRLKKGITEEELKKSPSGQYTRDDVLGGYVVPEDMSDRIMEFVFDDNDKLNVMTKTDNNYCSGDSLKLPTMPETSRKEGYRDAGVIAYWAAEADQFTSSTIKFGQQRLELHKVTALLYATEEQLADANTALGPIFSRKAGEAIRFKCNQAFYAGTGVGQPLGILRCNSTITVPLETSPVTQSTTQDVILHKNVNMMYHRMLPRYYAGAAWYCHPNLMEQLQYIYFLDDTTNKRPVFMGPGNGYGNLSNAPYGSMYGLPVLPWEYCFDAGQRGDIALINWAPYQTLQKKDGGIKAATSIHVRFLYEEQAFRFSFRIDGKSSLPSAVEDLNGSTRRSFAVVLAGRSSEGSSSGL